MGSKQKNTYRIFSIFIALAMFMPIGLSIAHSLEDHDHYVYCDNPSDLHFHDKTIDCDFLVFTCDKHGIIAFAKATTLIKPDYATTQITYAHNRYSTTVQKEPSRGPPSC